MSGDWNPTDDELCALANNHRHATTRALAYLVLREREANTSKYHDCCKVQEGLLSERARAEQAEVERDQARAEADRLRELRNEKANHALAAEAERDAAQRLAVQNAAAWKDALDRVEATLVAARNRQTVNGDPAGTHVAIWEVRAALRGQDA